MQKIFKALNAENFNIPAYPQETRLICYEIFEFLLENFKEYLLEKTKTPEFLQLVLDAIESEKDPRNILKMFSLIEKINLNFFKINKNTNDNIINNKINNDIDIINSEVMNDLNKSFFETLEIYYPIEFSPPKNSKENITANDLINSLNKAFSSNDYYMEFIFDILKGKNNIYNNIFLFLFIRPI